MVVDCSVCRFNFFLIEYTSDNDESVKIEQVFLLFYYFSGTFQSWVEPTWLTCRAWKSCFSAVNSGLSNESSIESSHKDREDESQSQAYNSMRSMMFSFAKGNRWWTMALMQRFVSAWSELVSQSSWWERRVFEFMIQISKLKKLSKYPGRGRTMGRTTLRWKRRRFSFFGVSRWVTLRCWSNLLCTWWSLASVDGDLVVRGWQL